MNIFVLNCGSSSLKYKMISMPSEKEVFGGEVQRIGSKTMESPRIVHRGLGNEEIYPLKVNSYKDALIEVIKIIGHEPEFPPDAFAHRLVHGGLHFPSSRIITKHELTALTEIASLAPIHNPHTIEVIDQCISDFPGIPQVLVLDTEFHFSTPEYVYTYCIPEKLRRELGIRKYGFHGISHQYVTKKTAEFLNISAAHFNAVSCHLGSGGASLCAVISGKSVDNSMGYSPLDGLIMSTRCGDLDPAIILKMMVTSIDSHLDVRDVLNNKSGILGVSGISSDIRDIIMRATNSYDERSWKTYDMYTWRIKKYLAAYLMVIQKADAIIFTDTIGESVPMVREAVCKNMDFFGIELDSWRNKTIESLPADIATRESKVRIVVVKTDEERSIATRAYEIIALDQANQEMNMDDELHQKRSFV